MQQADRVCHVSLCLMGLLSSSAHEALLRWWPKTTRVTFASPTPSATVAEPELAGVNVSEPSGRQGLSFSAASRGGSRSTYSELDVSSVAKRPSAEIDAIFIWFGLAFDGVAGGHGGVGGDDVVVRGAADADGCRAAAGRPGHRDGTAEGDAVPGADRGRPGDPSAVDERAVGR